MKKLLVSAIAAASAFAFGAAANAGALTVTQFPPGINESQLKDCIFGNNSLSCPDEYQLPAGQPNGSVTEKMRVYTVAEIRAIVGNVFAVGVDSNTAPGTNYDQVLTQFDFGIVGAADPLYYLSQPYTINPDVAQGNGFTDWIIQVFDLTGLSDDTMVKFTLSLTGLTDGAEQFFFVDLEEIPLPGAIWLMGAGLAGLGFAGRKKKKSA